MNKISSTKKYALVTGTLLFLVGLLGFAFRDNFNIADKYLLVALVFGFWGMVAGFQEGR